MHEQSYKIVKANFVDGSSDTTAEARARFKEYYPGRSARRMTHLGMMIGVSLHNFDTNTNTPIIYASEFAESKSLETFIDSFPEASPLHFQCSIHPSGVEQVLIPKKQEINNFYPITSNCNLAGQAIETAFLSQSPNAIISGGEEHGTWLSDYDLASKRNFACSLQLATTGDSIGTITLVKGRSPEANDAIDFYQLAEAVKNRANIKIPSFALDTWIHIVWE